MPEIREMSENPQEDRRACETEKPLGFLKSEVEKVISCGRCWWLGEYCKDKKLDTGFCTLQEVGDFPKNNLRMKN